MSRTRRGLGRAAPIVLTLAAVVLATPFVGCSSDTDEFCTALTEHYKLEPLVAAINAGDDAAVTRNLAELRKLEDTVPKELLADVHAVLDVMEETVRALTPAVGSDGDHAPIDRAALNLRLEAIQKSAQHITDYAERNCGITL